MLISPARLLACLIAAGCAGGPTLPSITMPAGSDLGSFINGHKGYKVAVPLGTYRLHNGGGQSGLTLDGFYGEVDFAKGTKLLCDEFSTSSGWCVNVQNSHDVVFHELWVGYSVPHTPLSRDKSTNGAVQVWSSFRVVLYNSHVDASTGIGMVLGNGANLEVRGAGIYRTTADGLSFVNDSNSLVDGIRATDTGDDGLSVINYGFYANNVGFQGKNITSTNSMARGISVPGQSNVTISDFTVQNAAKSGIIVQDDFSFNTRRPTHVSFTDGTITGSGLYGAQVDAADDVSLTNVRVFGGAFGGFRACDSPCSNITLDGVSIVQAGQGSSVYVGLVTGGTLTNLTIDGGQTYGVYVTKSTGVMFSAVLVSGASMTDPLHRAWWAEKNVGPIQVVGLSVMDDEVKPTGYVVGEWSNPAQSISVTAITSSIPHGKLQIQTSSRGAVFQSK